MHRAKKMVIAATAAALLSASGMSSALANRPDDNDNITICHATGSESNPSYQLITVDEDEVDDHSDHEDDLIPAPEDDGVPFCPSGGTTPPGEEDPDDDDDGCIASSSSGDSTQSQSGLINVGNINLGLNNLLGNLFCQSNVGNGLAVALIGDAFGGDLDGDDDSDGDCIADDDSGDSEQEQEGLVNVGNLNLGLNNLLGNAFCQSNVLNGLAVSVIGTAVGGGSGLLSSGPLGLLSGVGYLVPGVMADVNVVASLLLSL
jgi:hypothetical protein